MSLWNWLVRDKTVLIATGFGTIALGGIATFTVQSDLSSATLVVVGAVLVALGLLLERIKFIKYGPAELHLAEARAYFEGAELADARGVPDAADELRDRGLEILRGFEEGTVSTAGAIRKLSEVARERAIEASSQALRAEGFTVERGLDLLASGFSLVGMRGAEKVGILVELGAPVVEKLDKSIRLGLHATHGLKGVVVVANVVSLGRRRGQGFAQSPLSHLERNLEVLAGEKARVRIVSWREGEPTEPLRTAIVDVTT